MLKEEQEWVTAKISEMDARSRMWKRRYKDLKRLYDVTARNLHYERIIKKNEQEPDWSLLE